MQLNTVVLPAPFGPIRAVIAPRPALKETLLMATSPPKRMLRCSTRSTGARFDGGAATVGPVVAAKLLIRGAPARVKAASISAGAEPKRVGYCAASKVRAWKSARAV